MLLPLTNFVDRRTILIDKSIIKLHLAIAIPQGTPISETG
jgi:hypothetical protein